MFVTKSIFPCLLFLLSCRKRKEQQCGWARFNCVSQLHIALISHYPNAWRALTQSFALSPLSIIFYLRINSPKKELYTHAYILLNNSWMVRIFLRIALCLFFVAVFFCCSHPIFFSHTLSRSSQRERGRESLINFHKWWTVVNCSLFSFMCVYLFVCTNTFTHMHACFNARLMNRSHLCSLTQTHTMWTEITVCCKKIFVFIGISHSLSHNRLQFGRVK